MDIDYRPTYSGTEKEEATRKKQRRTDEEIQTSQDEEVISLPKKVKSGRKKRGWTLDETEATADEVVTCKRKWSQVENNGRQRRKTRFCTWFLRIVWSERLILQARN